MINRRHEAAVFETELSPFVSNQINTGPRNNRYKFVRIALAVFAFICGIFFLLPRNDSCVAIYHEYGNNFNKVREIFHAFLIVKQSEGDIKYIDLDLMYPLFISRWANMYSWFMNNLDPDLFEVSVRGKFVGPYAIFSLCKIRISAQEIFGMEFTYEKALFKKVHPGVKYQQEAEQFLDAFRNANIGSIIVTVHKRNFESLAQCHASVREFGGKQRENDEEKYCNMDRDMVMNEFLPDYIDKSKVRLILLTDGQRPDTDATFEYIYEGSFWSSTWLMVISDYHVGTKASSIDLAVMDWRSDPATTFV